MESWPEALRKNVEILGTNARYYTVLLLDCGQDHLFENWDEPGTRDEDKLAFLKQVECYTPPTGGLTAYCTSTKSPLRRDTAYDPI